MTGDTIEHSSCVEADPQSALGAMYPNKPITELLWGKGTVWMHISKGGRIVQSTPGSQDQEGGRPFLLLAPISFPGGSIPRRLFCDGDLVSCYDKSVVVHLELWRCGRDLRIDLRADLSIECPSHKISILSIDKCRSEGFKNNQNGSIFSLPNRVGTIVLEPIPPSLRQMRMN